jgi:glycosyltransferase involved in cell wall biosynthesis
VKFSLIIPTYNEEKDIGATLNCLIKLRYPDKEIIVVDDSIDTTPQIVSAYAGRGVKLICPEVRKGRCEARNIGIRSSSGDVLVILNADVRLPEDFLGRIKHHYEAGYDSVTVFSEVANKETMYARYIDLLHQKKVVRGVYEQRKTTLNGIYWSEGFSVRRELAMRTSLFPSGYVLPIEAGEDVNFVDELREIGCKGIVDETIKIHHIAPDNLTEYWYIRKGRGAGTPQIRRFINGWSYKKIFSILVLKAVKRFLLFVTVIPMVYYNYDLAGYGKKNRIFEALRLCWCWMLEQAANSAGEFHSLKKIVAKEKF